MRAWWGEPKNNPMTPSTGKRKVCSRGHVFIKSSDCPICPKCWAGYYRKKHQQDFPAGLSAPALRGLLKAKITRVSHLTRWTEADVVKLHGLGPKAMRQLKRALRQQNLSFVKKK